jgi:hypothetical protein
MITIKESARPTVRMLLTCALLCVAAVPAAAQNYAVRAGMNVNPDQVYGGAQYNWPLAERVWLQPNGDVGIGNDATLVAVNFDAVYRRPLGRKRVWSVYGGGGPALNFYKLLGYTATEAGASAVGGVIHQTGLMTEFRVGFLESPQYRLGVGYAFGRNNASRPRPRR